MAAHDRIRLNGQLREGPASVGSFYFQREREKEKEKETHAAGSTTAVSSGASTCSPGSSPICATTAAASMIPAIT